MTDKALYLNGVYDRILNEITEIHKQKPTQGLFIQPTGNSIIKLLQEAAPSPANPVILYSSTTEDLRNVRYTAEIVGWDDKRELDGKRRERAERIIEEFQKQEGAGLFDAANLIEVRQMRRFAEPLPVEKLVKTSDGKPLSANRTRSGGFSYVHPLADTPPFAD